MKTQFSLIAFLVMILLNSCTHYYYMQNVQNVPLFKEKNEFRATLATNSGDETNATEINAAYSITNKFAVMAAYCNYFGGNINTNNWASGKYGEVGFGYFKNFKKPFVFETFAGIGQGNQHHSFDGVAYSNNTNTADLSLVKLFVQPSFGITYKALDVAFSMRANYLSFYNIKNNIFTENINYYDVENISLSRNSILFEPVLTIRAGWKYGKLQSQFGGSYNYTNPYLKFETTFISMGLFVNISKRYWTTEAKRNKKKKVKEVNF